MLTNSKDKLRVSSLNFACSKTIKIALVLTYLAVYIYFISEKLFIKSIYLCFLIPIFMIISLFLDWRMIYKGKIHLFTVISLHSITIFLLLSSQLFFHWQCGFSSSYSCQGLLPLSDASGYVDGAKSLLSTGELNQFSARRPLCVMIYTFLFAISQENLQLVLIIQVFILGLACLFFSIEVQKHIGSFASLLMAIILTGAIRPYVSSFMTENFGFTFGLLSLTYFLRGFRRNSSNNFELGLVFLAVGLNIRPSAMVILPALIIYFYYISKFNLRHFIRILIFVGLVCSINPILYKLFAPSGSEYMGNISYTLYGLVSGGKGWEYVLSQHPEIKYLSSDQLKTQYIYELCWNVYQKTPLTFWKTLIYEIAKGIVDSPEIFFQRVLGVPFLVMKFFYLIGAVLLFTNKQNNLKPLCTFLLISLLSIFICAPILNDAGPRAYLTLFPYYASCLFLPIWWLKSKYQLNINLNYHEATRENGIHIFALLLTILTVSGTIIGSSDIFHPNLAKAKKSHRENSGHEYFFIYINPKSAIQSSNGTEGSSKYIEVKDWKKQVYMNYYFDIGKNILPGEILVHGWDVLSQTGSIYFILNPNMIHTSGWVSIYGQRISENTVRASRVELFDN